MSSLPIEFEELDDWLWCLRTAVVACYAIRDRDGVVLVDANVAGQHGAILDALADRLGAPNGAVPVRQVLLTHAHPRPLRVCAPGGPPSRWSGHSTSATGAGTAAAASGRAVPATSQGKRSALAWARRTAWPQGPAASSRA